MHHDPWEVDLLVDSEDGMEVRLVVVEVEGIADQVTRLIHSIIAVSGRPVTDRMGAACISLFLLHTCHTIISTTYSQSLLIRSNSGAGIINITHNK